MVNYEWYRTFKAIYESGTLTSAAQVLFASQPGVSLHLNSLEAYVGFKLFERKARRMIPTERGKVLYAFLQEPLSRLEEAEKVFKRSTNDATPTVSIGMCFETFQYSLEKHISSLPFNLVVQFGHYIDLLEKLEKGIVDIVINPNKDESRPILFEPFSEERIALICGSNTITDGFIELIKSKNHENIQLWLKQQKWFGTTGEMEHLNQFWQANFAQRPNFRPNFIVPNINSIVRCLSSASGLAVIPTFLCKKEVENGQISILWEGYAPYVNTIYFATVKGCVRQHEIESIKGILREEM